MPFDPSRIPDPAFFAENRVPAHSDHRCFASTEEVEHDTSSLEISLSGTWKFQYSKNIASAPVGFEKLDYDCSAWDDIRVPGHIQLQGYDRAQYCNVQYPWDGFEEIQPGDIPHMYNPVASYVTWFEARKRDGERITISFLGAESSIAVWLNGTYLGYSCDPFTPAEFDITDALVDGPNKLAAQVFRFSGASWIEDQDMFRFSGLFRDVVLYRQPACHLRDVRVSTDVSADLATAVIRLDMDVTGGSVRVTFEGADIPCHTGNGVIQAEIALAEPHLWSAEDPYLCSLTIEVQDDTGATSECIPLHVGVRRFGIEDGLLKINGRRVVFKGVNRHEFGLDGRAMTRERTEADLKIMKAAGINALRTSHYPNNTYLYELADIYGLYVIDEMDLESHGLWDAINHGKLTIEEAVPGDRPEWLPALIDRAASMLERDKNHPSVVMWSCGNESFGGTDILAVTNWFRAHDSRPAHYEGVHWDPRYPETSDVVSQMYTPAADIEDYLQTHRGKPFILCEYAHAMGNSFGAVDKYMDLAYREPLFQGGFIWDFADQAVRCRDRYGREFFGYGGDSGEMPHDLDFSGNGILFADHSPSPKMQEVAYLYQSIHTVIDLDTWTFQACNRQLFADLSGVDCVVTVAREGVEVDRARVCVDVAPEKSATYGLGVARPVRAGEYTVTVSYRLKEPTLWAEAGHEVAWELGVLVVPEVSNELQPVGGGASGSVGSTIVAGSPHDRAETSSRPAPAFGLVNASPRPRLIDGIANIGVRGDHFTALFSRGLGGLMSYRYGLTPDGGRELLAEVPKPCFWHAPTANERGWGMPNRDGQWLLASRYAVAGPPTVSDLGERIEVRYIYDLPTTPTSQCQVTYSVDGEGAVEVTMVVTPGEGLLDMPEYSLMMPVSPALTHLTWYGFGKEECYLDRMNGARLAVYTADVADLLPQYLRPQESGSRTGVRWARLTDNGGWGLHLWSAGWPSNDAPTGMTPRAQTALTSGMELSVLPWTPFEIENARHPHELPLPIHTVIRPALMRRGVGGDQSWGAMTHPEYRLPAGRPLTFRFGFQGIL